jgi:signal transduction histidine kinase
MASLRPTRKPAFFWQAGLILLPVVIIAAVASRAIIQSRAEVEREARQRAEEIAGQYSKELERRMGSLLLEHDVLSDRWVGHLTEVTGAWPGSGRRAQAEAEWPPPQDPPYPGWRADEVFPDRFGLTADGRFLEGLEYNPAPQPPTWFTSLSAAQRAAWEALGSAVAAGAGKEEIERRITEFEETGPGLAAKLNAAYVGLRARLATLPPAAAVTEALRLAGEGTFLADRLVGTDGTVRPVNRQPPGLAEHWETLSEAGLPLVNLAFGEALRYARVTGPSEKLWDAIPSQVLHASSPLIPVLLDQLQELAGTNTALQVGVGAWRTLWNARLKLYDIADAIRQTGELRGVTTTNSWIEYDQTRWLCILNPGPALTVETENGVARQPTNGFWTAVRFLPKSVVEQALAREFETSEVKLPSYLGLTVWLEGEPLNLPKRWCPGRDAPSARAVLAETTGALSATTKLQEAPAGPDTDHQMLPSHPRFGLQLYLADPARLFASYRRHAMLMAGLVAASAFAALIGVLASWRAFQRQLRLIELKSNFVSSVSHELRSPIASVRLMAESLERGKVPEAPKQHEYFRFIVQETRRLSALIENVLDFSRIEQGRKQYDFEPTDLVALTQQTVKLMETYAAEREVKLQLQLNNAPPSAAQSPSAINYQLPDYQLLADGKALQQALVNLIDNALKHSPKGDTVTVGLKVRSPKSKVQSPKSEIGSQTSEPTNTHHVSRFTFHASHLHLWVEDHGEGIPPSEQEKIFERFYRRGSELRRQTQGVGIGLSIVKHIVEAHGGRVLVRSAVGEGSRFTIELPLSPIVAKPETRNPKPE